VDAGEKLTIDVSARKMSTVRGAFHEKAAKFDDACRGFKQHVTCKTILLSKGGCCILAELHFNIFNKKNVKRNNHHLAISGTYNAFQ
jgi:hypothetical protein